MKKLLITFGFSFIIFQTYSQWIRDISGRPYRSSYESDLQGSPFLFSEWRMAKIKFKTLGEFDDVQVKFSPFTNSFYYNKNDSVYEFPDELEEVRVKDKAHVKESGYDMVFVKNIQAAGKIPSGTFVQVLSKGKINLLKYYVGKIDENQGSGTFGGEGKVKKMVTRSNVVAIKDNHAENIQYNKKTLQALTADKEAAMTNFLSKKELNIKKEMDFSVAISYYNLISQ